MEFLKILKIFKIFSYKHNKALCKLYEILFTKNYSIEKTFNSIIFLIIIISIFHVFICFHIFLGKQSYPNWIISNNLINSSFIDIYIASFYFIITTITTVGYGDIVCISFAEVIFQIILLTIGIIAYSWIVSSVSNRFSNKTKAMVKYEKDINLLEEIRIAYPEMKFKLYNKIKKRLNLLYKKKEKCDLHILVDSLPYSLRNIILNKVYVQIIHNFKIFKGSCIPEDFINKFLKNLIPITLSKDAVIFKGGEKIETAVFIQKGVLSLGVLINPINIQFSLKKFIRRNLENSVNVKDENSSILDKNFDDIYKNTVRINFEDFEKEYNKQKIKDFSEFHDSIFDEEINKLTCNEYENNEKINIFLTILNLYKNENFGIGYMLLDKSTALSLKVRSPKADLFLLRKCDYINIYRAYPKIWKKICNKSYRNVIGIEKKTKIVIEKYCKNNGIILHHHQENKYSISYLSNNENQSSNFIKNDGNKINKIRKISNNNLFNNNKKEAEEIVNSNLDSSINIESKKKLVKINKKFDKMFTFKNTKFSETTSNSSPKSIITKRNYKKESFNPKTYSKLSASNVVRRLNSNSQKYFSLDKNVKNDIKNKNSKFFNKGFKSENSSPKTKSEEKKISFNLIKYSNKTNSKKDKICELNEKSINRISTKETIVLKEKDTESPITISDLPSKLIQKIKLKVEKNKNKDYNNNFCQTLINSVNELIMVYEEFNQNNSGNPDLFNEKILINISNIKNLLNKANIPKISNNENNMDNYEDSSNKKNIIINNDKKNKLNVFEKLTKINVESFGYIKSKNKKSPIIININRNKTKKNKNIVDFILKKNENKEKNSNRNQLNTSSLDQIFSDSSMFNFSVSEIKSITGTSPSFNEDNLNFIKALNQNDINKRLSSNTYIINNINNLPKGNIEIPKSQNKPITRELSKFKKWKNKFKNKFKKK